MDGRSWYAEIEITKMVIEAIEHLQIHYMIAGSLALFAHGIPRATRDSDLVIQVRRGDGSRIAEQLGPDFYCDAEMAEEAIQRHSSFSALHMREIFKVDLFVLRSDPYNQEAFRRRIPTMLQSNPPRPAFVEAAEDTMLAKLRWYRLGGEVSEQQWKDVLGILKVQRGVLDQAYLRRWAEHEGVLDLLNRAIKGAE